MQTCIQICMQIIYVAKQGWYCPADTPLALALVWSVKTFGIQCKATCLILGWYSFFFPRGFHLLSFTWGLCWETFELLVALPYRRLNLRIQLMLWVNDWKSLWRGVSGSQPSISERKPWFKCTGRTVCCLQSPPPRPPRGTCSAGAAAHTSAPSTAALTERGTLPQTQPRLTRAFLFLDHCCKWSHQFKKC